MAVQEKPQRRVGGPSEDDLLVPGFSTEGIDFFRGLLLAIALSIPVWIVVAVLVIVIAFS